MENIQEIYFKEMQKAYGLNTRYYKNDIAFILNDNGDISAVHYFEKDPAFSFKVYKFNTILWLCEMLDELEKGGQNVYKWQQFKECKHFRRIGIIKNPYQVESAAEFPNFGKLSTEEIANVLQVYQKELEKVRGW